MSRHQVSGGGNRVHRNGVEIKKKGERKGNRKRKRERERDAPGSSSSKIEAPVLAAFLAAGFPGDAGALAGFAASSSSAKMSPPWLCA